MTQTPTGKTWRKTRMQNLVRHKSGIYYARAFGGRKEVWKSLKTSHFGVAQSKLASFMKQHRAHLAAETNPGRGKMTFGEALVIQRRKIKDDVEKKNTKPSTEHYWTQIFAALLKSWPLLEQQDIRKIRETACEEWARRFARTSSPTRFNNTLGGLRHVFKIGLDAGLIHTDPSAKVERMTIRKKRLQLPSVSEFAAVVEKIRSAGGWCSKDCADLVEGLAFTGLRKGEAAEVERRDLLFQRDQIVVRGNSENGTKNWEERRIPMVPAARELFERMLASRDGEPRTEKVFRVKEAQKAIDAACRKVGVARITHHDLRHLFATTCIESGIDIPTIAGWLGHKDGGVLAMKTYGHLRDEHSSAQAKRVSFGETRH